MAHVPGLGSLVTSPLHTCVHVCATNATALNGGSHGVTCNRARREPKTARRFQNVLWGQNNVHTSTWVLSDGRGNVNLTMCETGSNVCVVQDPPHPSHTHSHPPTHPSPGEQTDTTGLVTCRHAVGRYRVAWGWPARMDGRHLTIIAEPNAAVMPTTKYGVTNAVRAKRWHPCGTLRWLCPP